MEERQTILAFIWKTESSLWEWEVEEQNLQGVSVVSGPLLCPQGVGEPETQRAVWALTASSRALASPLPECTKKRKQANSPHQLPHICIMTTVIWSSADTFIQSLQCTVFYIQIVLSIV